MNKFVNTLDTGYKWNDHVIRTVENRLANIEINNGRAEDKEITRKAEEKRERVIAVNRVKPKHKR